MVGGSKIQMTTTIGYTRYNMKKKKKKRRGERRTNRKKIIIIIIKILQQ